jgi:hypothetical protein
MWRRGESEGDVAPQGFAQGDVWMHRYEQLAERILSFVERGEGSFEELSLELFEYQFERNTAYRRYCEKLRITPNNIVSWKQIPPVPTLAFKFFDLACEPLEKAKFVFTSSGTTLGRAIRSKHYIFDARFYETACCNWFKRHVLPDDAMLPFLILFPPFEELRNSSLAFMIDLLKRRFSSNGGEHFVLNGKLHVKELMKRLESTEEPVCLLGTSLSFLEFVEECERLKVSFNLPQGSRLMDTGGFKGVRKEIAKEELYERYELCFGIPRSCIINEYGMTELSSQFYDAIFGMPSARVFKAPHWVRTVVVDPITLEEVEEGGVGILRHYDLCNVGSSFCVQTDDIAVKLSDGFVLLGRAKGSEQRGCSLLAEEWHTMRV